MKTPGQDTSFRRLTRDTAVYLSGNVLSRAVSFIMLPVYTRFLTPRDYGILQILDLAVDIVAILITSGVTAGVSRFFFKADSEEQRKGILSTAFLAQLALAGTGTVLLLLMAPLLWQHVLGAEGTVTMVRIAAVNFSLGTLLSVPMTLLMVRQQPGWFVAFGAIRLIFQVGLNILFVVVFRWGPQGVLLSTLATSLVLGGTAAVLLLRHTGIRFSWAAWSDLRRFGLPHQFARVGTFILAFGDRFFLEHYHGLAVVGVYGIAYQFGFILTGNIGAPFMQAWNPQRYQIAKAEKPERDARYNRGFRYGSLLLVTAAVTISVMARPMLAVLVTPEFRGAAEIIPIVLAAYLMQAWTDVVGFGIGISERTVYTSYATWAAVAVCLVMYALLIPPLGGLGAAVATLVAMTVRLVLHFFFSQRLWHVAYDWRPHLVLLGWGILCVLPAFLILPEGFLAQLFGGAVLLALFLLLAWTRVLTPGDRALVVRLARAPREFGKLISEI